MDDTTATTRQAQGIEPSNPYQTLCIHPAAPRELVDEAYWLLVERARTTRASSASEQVLSALNRAYEVLSDADRRHELDRKLGSTQVRSPRIRLRRSAGWPLAARKFAADYANFYHVLRVDPAADSAIIALAYRVLSARAAGPWADTTFLRRLLLDAYDVLGNPARRAIYDRSIGIGMPSAGKPATTAAIPSVADSGPDVAAHGMPGEDGAAAEEPGARESADEMPLPEYLRVDANPPLDEEAARAPTIESDRGVAAPVPAPNGGVAQRRRNWFSAILRTAPGWGQANDDGQVDTGRQPTTTEDAEERLRTLHSAGGAAWTPEARPWHPDVGAAVATAELVFIDGPRSGASVSLGDEAVTVGSAYEADVMLPDDSGAVAPEHVRIWRHGDRFVLRQIADNGTLVGGEAPALRLVILDDGDEIQIGAHRMRFSLTG